MYFFVILVLLLILTAIQFYDYDVEISKITLDSLIGKNRKCIYDNVEEMLTNYIDSNVCWMDDSNATETGTVTAQAKAMMWLKKQSQTEIELCNPYSTLQRYVFAILYYSTNGNNWLQQGNFLSKKNVCDWKGVSCDENNFVATKIKLDANNLQGKIPDEIGTLKYLEKLHFGFNLLDGTMPSTIGKLESLQELHLEGNFLTGSIPTELGDLTSLRIISLYENNLTGSAPKEFVNLKTLRELYLFDNDISGNLNHLCPSTNLMIQIDCRKSKECECCLC